MAIAEQLFQSTKIAESTTFTTQLPEKSFRIGIFKGNALEKCPDKSAEKETHWVIKSYMLDDLLTSRNNIANRLGLITSHSAEFHPAIRWELDEAFGTLKRFTRRLPRVARQPSASDLGDIALSLDEAHKNDLIHGDLNRKNVLLTETGCALVDWEPWLTQRIRGRITMMATRPYIHPDDLINRRLSKLTDLVCYAAYVIGSIEGFSHARQLASARDEELLDLARSSSAMEIFQRVCMTRSHNEAAAIPTWH